MEGFLSANCGTELLVSSKQARNHGRDSCVTAQAVSPFLLTLALMTHPSSFAQTCDAIVVFDPNRILEKATLSSPKQYP
jgi:hypothetical protein